MCKTDRQTDVTFVHCIINMATEDGECKDCKQDIKWRVWLASAIIGKLGKIWKSRNVSTPTMVKACVLVWM